jgi:hypothetical protein
MKSLKEIEEATKAVRNQKPKPNMMLVSLSWSIQMLLPYDDGLTLMGALKNAELLEDSHGTNPKIKPFDKESVRGNLFSSQKYEDIKVAAMLDISLEELESSRNSQPVPV